VKKGRKGNVVAWPHKQIPMKRDKKKREERNLTIKKTGIPPYHFRNLNFFFSWPLE